MEPVRLYKEAGRRLELLMEESRCYSDLFTGCGKGVHCAVLPSSFPQLISSHVDVSSSFAEVQRGSKGTSY